MGKLADEIKSKPFAHLEDEAALNIIRTADVIVQRGNQFLRPFEITGSQYNVLRILRGSPQGLSCGQVAERMISRDPDITRLLDRLEVRGLIERERDGQDRRVVVARITTAGLELVNELDPLMVIENRRQLGGLGAPKLRQLIELLEQARELPCPAAVSPETELPSQRACVAGQSVRKDEKEQNENHLPD